MTISRRLAVAAGLGLLTPVVAMAGDPVLTAELLADAAGRAVTPAPPEAFTVDVHGFILFRYNWNHRDSADTFVAADPSGNSNETTNGFQLPYTKLQLGGKIISDAWNYGIQFKFNEFDGVAVLDDAWGSFKCENGLVVKWGQFKPPLLREETTSDAFQLSANRSVMNSTFTIGRSQGVLLSQEMERVRWGVEFDDGARTNNTDYTATNEADYGLTARVDVKWAGEWKQAKDFTSFQGDKNFGMAGVAAHYQNGGDTWGTADTSMTWLTGDVGLEGNGWNAYGAVVYRHSEPAVGPSFSVWGVLVQGGVFVSPSDELFARYDVVVPDSDRATDDDLNTFTVGVNHYFAPGSHAAKFTLDFELFSGAQSQSIAPASTLTGLLPASKDSQWAVQAQMQIMF